MKQKLGPEALEHGNLNRVLCSLCIPSLASNLVTSLYNIVDQLFIGNRLGVAGNAATNVVFPAVTLITSLSLMCGVGSSAVMNLSYGRGDTDRAKRAVCNGFGLMVFCGLVVTLALLLFTRPLLYLFGCTDGVYPLAASYARIVSIGFVFAVVGAAGPFLLRADGSPNYSLACILVGSVLNIGLDALFIFVFDWGIEGAAWATVISQIVSAVMVLAYLPRFRTFPLKLRDFVPQLRLMGRIAALGAGPMFNFMTQALVQVFLNNALRTYGALAACGSEVALAVAGVAGKVNTLATAIVTGLTNGMQPIISYNYGRKNYRRVAQTGKRTVGVILILSFVLFLCYQLIPRQITALFGDGTPEYFDFAARFFRIFYMLICLNGLQSSVGGFFSAQGKPFPAILISLTRQIIFLPPLLILLPRRWGLDGVLWAGPIADLAMAILAATLLLRAFAKLRQQERLQQA